MKKYIIVLLFFCFSNIASAQYQEVEEEYVKHQSIDGLYIGIVPIALINPWTGYQAKINYGFADLIQLQINGGILYGKRSSYRFSGYRIRPGIKLFLPAGNQEFDRFYIALEYNIRKIKEKGDAEFARFGGVFIEELPIERITKSKSFILSFGSRTVVDNRFYIEAGMGVGLGPLQVTTTQYENADHIVNANWFRPFQVQGEYTMTNILIHLSLGIKIF